MVPACLSVANGLRTELSGSSRFYSQMMILDFWLEIELNQFSFSFIEVSELLNFRTVPYAGILICIFKIFYEFLKDAQSSQVSHGDKSMMDLSLSAVRVSRNTDFFYQSGHNESLHI